MVPFPPLVAFTLGTLGAALVVRHLAKEWRRAKADLNRAEDAPVEAAKREAIPKLRRDPKSGVYRP